MQKEHTHFLESGITHTVLMILGTLLLIIALLQLPLSVYFQNTKPALDWRRLEKKKEGLVVAPVQRAQDGPFAGKLQKGDIITNIDGILTDSASMNETRLWNKIVSLSLGDTLHLTVLRDGATVQISAVLDVSKAEYFGDQISIIQYITYNVAPLVTVLIALIILIRQRKKRLSALFALVSFAISFYLCAVTQYNTAMPWWKWMGVYSMYVAQMVLYFFFALLVHLLLVFPFERRIRGSLALRNILIYLPPVIFTFIVAVLIWGFRITIQSEWLDYVIIAYFILYPVIGVGLLISSYRRAISPAVKKVVIVLGVGVGLFAVGSGMMLILGNFVTDIPDPLQLWIRIALLIMMTCSLPLSFGYAILRYGFMDVRVIVKQATVYVILSGIVIAGFIGMYLVLQNYDASFSQSDVLFLSLIVSGILLFSVIILKDRIQLFVSKHLFRKEYEVEQRLHAVTQQLLRFLERDALLEFLSAELASSMELRAVSIFHATDDGTKWICGTRVPVEAVLAPLEYPEVRRQLTSGNVLIVNTIEGTPFNPDVHALFAMVAGDGGAVLVVLGEKKSGKPYTEEELELLSRIADHASLGWRNAEMTEEMKDRERIKKEVEIAQSIQMSLLPHGMPQVPGLDIAAYSTSALEVGGDFYDVLPLTGGTLAVTVGDVSDKGISAAMVMASAMSTLRFAAEIHSTPKDMLESANHRLYFDTRKQMFVAVCTAIIDPVQRTMTFTNAGLPKPILYRHGEAYAIEWSDNGEHLPLGAKRDTWYHEQTVDLVPGDILLLYTDGVVESVNEYDEEFGVKRLKQAIAASKREPCERILQRIHDDIHAFTGTAVLFDDITMVCLRVV